MLIGTVKSLEAKEKKEEKKEKKRPRLARFMLLVNGEAFKKSKRGDVATSLYAEKLVEWKVMLRPNGISVSAMITLHYYYSTASKSLKAES